MDDKKFNLLEEPWVCVMQENGEVKELSLIDTLIHAHQYRRLSGELPTQDVAVLRLLLAVLQTVVYRYDADGNEDELVETEDAYERWEEIWNEGKLPEKPIREYLAKWKERFYLYDSDRPFYQVPKAVNGTKYTAAKLNGEISESNNKLRLFVNRARNEKKFLSDSEAARWLLYLNGFDDASAKPKQSGLPSPGTGWLGKLGLIYADGNNLFETLMLNLVLVNISDKECWDSPKPVWEAEKVKSAERTEIAVPSNQAELLTVQSRRILLEKEEQGVSGYYVLGGDFFPQKAADMEQMTVWNEYEPKGNAASYCLPRRHSPEKQMWRDFSNLIMSEQGNKTPGVLEWVAWLKTKKKIDEKKIICFKTAFVQYDGKKSAVEDIYGDYLELHTDLLTANGKTLVKIIRDEIKKCEQAANIVNHLIEDLKKAEGNCSGKKNHYGKEEYFYQIDIPFRRWLKGLDPMGESDSDYYENIRNDWRIQAYRIAEKLGMNYVEQAGDKAFVGREIQEKKDGVERKVYYSSSSAFNIFKGLLKKCFEQ
ncbi:type I-E CRISPR-associated protein Cse1/CasA [Clostridium sp.]